MENNYIDNLIKNALEGFEVPYTSEAWHLMQNKIELEQGLSSTDNNTVFDNKIKDALESIEPAYTPAAWTLMESRISLEDGLVEADATAEFDANLKDALQEVEVNYTPDAWEMMEARLDLETNLAELEDTDLVDALAYNNLNNLEVPYDATSWTPLSEKIDEEFSFRRRILYRYKVAEVALLLLFLLTAVRYYPVRNQVVTKIKEEVASIKQKIEPNQLFNKEIIIDDDLIVTKTKKEAIVEAQHSTQSPVQNKTANTVKKTVKNPTAFDLEPKLSNSSTAVNLQESSITTLTEITNKSAGTILPNSQTLLTAEKVSTKMLLGDASLSAAMVDESAVSIPSLKSRFLKEKAQDVIECILCKPFATPLQVKAAMFIIGDYNYIMTPYDRDFDLKAYNHASNGYGVGFTFGFALGNWEVETGGIYAAKRYEPKSVPELLGDFQTGYIENRLKEIQLNVIQVPLNIRYSFDKLPNWNVYALAGASLNVASTANYYFETTYATRPQFGAGQSSQELIEEESTYNNKIFSNGWFEGGSFQQNSYFTANLGLGMERKVSSKWSIFMQNSYQHTLLTSGIGLGPNKDRLNTISILAGARATLK